MEALGYIAVIIGTTLIPVAMIVGHELGEQARRRQASKNTRKSVQES